ncbi:hypothetical protein BDB01DRAFT_776974 [Pilobolus umbonatus]|nr:hypothetical protein BDB01DRAFT_776974 [Pilobolus umbonatus]
MTISVGYAHRVNYRSPISFHWYTRYLSLIQLRIERFLSCLIHAHTITPLGIY